ncbi:MAG TPA: terminase endonuclease subunit [Lysobacter sp.]
MTLARRHFQRASAAAASAAADPGELINANAYELALASLIEHKRRLKEVQSIERKIEIKRQLLPDYEPWIDGVLEAGRGGQDAVLMTVMVWRIDTGDYVGALRIAEYALKHDLAMPDQYQRGVATLVVEEIADQALAALSAGGSFSYYVLAIVGELTSDCDMPDEVRAKQHKAIGLVMVKLMDGSPEASALASEAIEHLRRAVQLNERVGVKKDIERLERFIKNNSDSALPAANAGTGSQSTIEQAQSAAETGASGDAVKGQSGAPAPEN